MNISHEQERQEILQQPRHRNVKLEKDKNEDNAILKQDEVEEEEDEEEEEEEEEEEHHECADTKNPESLSPHPHESSAEASPTSRSRRESIIAWEAKYEQDRISPCSPYQLIIYLSNLVLGIFFRVVGMRGSHRIPKRGPVIFVAAPHHNQFVDPLMLVHTVMIRPIYFLIAEKSMHKAIVGFCARMIKAIPVVRPQDSLLKGGKDGIALSLEQYCKDSNVTVSSVLEGLKQKYPKRMEDDQGNSASDPQRYLFIKNFDLKAKLMGKKDTPVGWQICLSNKPTTGSDFENPISISEIFYEESLILLRKPLITASSSTNNSTSNIHNNNNHNNNQPSTWYFNFLPVVDQSATYEKVFDRLKMGHAIGIFPEGGSHDRAEMLPLKAGVTIMALGAMARYPDLSIKIVPVGLTYFHAHKFRSRAMVEYGIPLSIPQRLVQMYRQGGDQKRAACAELLKDIREALGSVTVQAPNYETLQLIQAVKRLYRPTYKKNVINGNGNVNAERSRITRLTPFQELELTRRFIKGYLHFREDPRVQDISSQVATYNRLLGLYGLRDHQVLHSNYSSYHIIYVLVTRALFMILVGVIAAPGIFYNLPIAIVADHISRQKAKEALLASNVKIKGRDVLATWKVMVSMVLVPTLYVFYTILFAIFVWGLSTPHVIPASLAFLFVVLPVTSMASIMLTEQGLDAFRGLRHVAVTLWQPDGNRQLGEMRKRLRKSIIQLVEELGPKLFSDYYNAEGGLPLRSNPLTEEDETASPQHPGFLERFVTSLTPKMKRAAAEGEEDEQGEEKNFPVTSSSASKSPAQDDDLLADWHKLDESEIDDYFFFEGKKQKQML